MTEQRPLPPLVFLPLGGAGEIGMNLSLYGYGGKWLMVDCGVTFANGTLPGVDLIAPDASFIETHRDDLIGLVATHAHEDHIGAIPYLWPKLRCPVYATGFTASVLRRKLAEVGLEAMVPIHDMKPGEALDLGPFKVTAISITHSIPEANALAIETPHGTVLHSGDWKLDPDPLVGSDTDVAALQKVGEEGALALICDSTNVFSPGTSGSEASVRDNLRQLLKGLSGRIAVTTFASNVARIETIALVAAELGREVVLVGRSLGRIVQAAKENGYLRDLKPFLDERDCGYLPRERLLLLCTGCQGEPRGAMARIAADEHPHIALSEGDVAVFSSKIIPGNEKALYRLHNMLAASGIEVMTERDHLVHVSGHPSRDELAQMYRWVRPKIAVPVHGEARHIIEHARLAKSLQVPKTATLENGEMLRLAPGPAEVIERVPAGRLAVDAGQLIPVEGGVIGERRKLMYNGSIQVSLALTEAGNLAASSQISAKGVLNDPDGSFQADLEAALQTCMKGLPRTVRRDDEQVAEAVRQALRRVAKQAAGRNPMLQVHVLRLAKGLN